METRDKTLFVVLILLNIFNLVDTTFTYVAFVHAGGVELNPLMKLALDVSPLFFIFLKIVLMSVATFYLWRHRMLKSAIFVTSLYFLNFLFQAFQLHFLL